MLIINLVNCLKKYKKTERYLKEPDKMKKKMKKTEKILAKIKEKSSKKLDKSYALIEFENYESKQKALLTELRVFGLQIAGNMCFTDDADYKLTLMCNNVHWGASLEKFCECINEKLIGAKHPGNIFYFLFFYDLNRFKDSD